MIILPITPDENLENLKKSPEYLEKIFYIQGDPLLDKDLKRCNVE